MYIWKSGKESVGHSPGNESKSRIYSFPLMEDLHGWSACKEGGIKRGEKKEVGSCPRPQGKIQHKVKDTHHALDMRC